MLKRLSLLSFALLFVAPANAFAVSKKVSSPNVTEGKFAVENKGSIEFDDRGDKWKNKTELEYGLSDRVKVVVEGELEKEEGESLDYAATEFGATYKLTDDSYYLKSAVKGAYEINHQDGADEIKLKLMLEKSYGEWKQRANIALEHEVGDDSEDGVALGLALGSYYKFDEFELGGEYYADFGRLKDDNDYDDQEHHIGPVVGFDIPVAGYEIESKLGYLVGISDAAADNVIKYEFEIEF